MILDDIIVESALTFDIGESGTVTKSILFSLHILAPSMILDISVSIGADNSIATTNSPFSSLSLKVFLAFFSKLLTFGSALVLALITLEFSLIILVNCLI
ncbi:hypothetical protein B0I65_003670 [Clostridium beijerinckii]|nr:hypothetical protein [Clostridium beijerinckii]